MYHPQIWKTQFNKNSEQLSSFTSLISMETACGTSHVANRRCSPTEPNHRSVRSLVPTGEAQWQRLPCGSRGTDGWTQDWDGSRGAL